MNAAAHTPSHDLTNVSAPAPLRDLPAWLCWKQVLDTSTGKWRKVPFYPEGSSRKGRHGTPEDRRQLKTFDDALAAAQRRGFDGIGFATLEDWGVCAIDFDDCVTAGRVRADVLQACEGTYCELSPSGQGVRAFVRGDFGNRKDHDYGIELFSTAGFVTVTGRALQVVELLGLHDTVAEPAPALRALITQRFGREDQPEAGTGDVKPLGLTPHQLREALDVLDPGMRHDPWLKIGMALHHETGGEGFHLWDEWSSRGASYPGAQALRARWDSFGQGGQRPVTAHFLVRTANENGAHIDLTQQAPDDFDVVEEPPATARPMRFPVISDAEFMDRPPMDWIVKGLLPRAEVAMIYGESTAGKSFVALDLFAAIARGVPWFGLKTKQARVVYVVAEGARGFRNRLVAYRTAREASPGFKLIDAAPNLLVHEDAVDTAKSIAASGGADVVVLDTFAQVTPGGNENAGEDMGKALAACKGISRALGGAMVVLVHHTGKDATKGARGWSGLKGACDAQIEVVRTPTGRLIQVPKEKDGDDTGRWGFQLQVVPIGMDEDGDVITSCVVAAAALPVVSKVPTLARKLGRWERHVMDAVTEIAVAQNTGIEAEAVLALAMGKETPPEAGKDMRRRNAKRALENLANDDDAPFVIEADGTLSML